MLLGRCIGTLLIGTFTCVTAGVGQIRLHQTDRENLSATEERESFSRRGFALQSEIPLYDPSETHFFAGGSIDTKLSYFDLTFGGDLSDKDVYVRLEYGMHLLYLIDEQDTKLCTSLGVGGIIGIHAEDWSSSRYEWLYQVPFFVVGLKYHFDRYSVTVGWKQNYALFGKMKDGEVIEEEVLKKGAVELKLCVY
jgi:hypothetical protein